MSAKGGVPCDLSHNAFDVTCMLSLHQLRLITSAAFQIVLGHVICDACWDTNAPMDRMTDTSKDIIFPQTLFAGGNNHRHSDTPHTVRMWDSLLVNYFLYSFYRDRVEV